MQIQLDTKGMPDKLRLVIETPPPEIEIALGTCPHAAKPRTAQRMTIDGIKDAVARSHGLTAKELDSSRRSERMGPIRQLAMFIATELTNYSLQQIAREFGKRDHTAVMYARDKIKDRMKSDEGYRNKVRALIASCQEAADAPDV